MARLPTPGSDNGNWGSILNDYLSQSLEADGELKNGIVSEAKLSSAVQTKINQVSPTWSSLSGKPTTIAAGSDATAARTVINAVGKGDLVINAKDYGAVGDNATDDSAALQAALNAVPAGGTLYIPPGRYLINTAVSVTGKSVNINAHGAVLVQNADVDVLTIRGAFETIYNVSSLTPTNFSYQEVSNIQGLTVELSSTPTWARGDIVKVVADDEMPGARPSDTTSKNRTGQFFVVHAVSGTTVTLVGTLHDPFTTNIRIARMTKYTASVSGLRIESNNVEDWLRTGLRLISLYAPKVDVSFGVMPSIASSYQSCYRHQVNVVADGGNVAPSSGKNTYAVADIGSESGRYNIIAGYVRHAYSDGAGTVTPGSTTIASYGRPYGHLVTGIAHATLSTAWDTHTQAMNVTFANCVANDCQQAFSIRGRYNTVINGVAQGCNNGLYIFDEDRYGQDSTGYGHVVDGLILRDTPNGIRVTANFDDATAPTYGQREIHSSTIRNVLITGVKNTGTIGVTNQTLRLEDIRIVASSTVSNNYAAISITNSDVKFKNIELDWVENTTGNNMNGIETLSDSVVKGSGMKWLFNSGTESRISRVVTGTAGTLWDIDGVEIPYNITFPGAFGASGSRFDYVDLNEGRSNAWFGLSGANISDATVTAGVTMSKKQIVNVRCSTSGSNRTLAKLLTGAYRGQQMIITNADTTGTNTITVGHSTSTYGTLNLGGVAVTLRPQDAGCWAWDGSVWRQVWGPKITKIGTVASSATPTINTDSVDQFNITALATAITSMTTNLSGAPRDGQSLRIRFKDDGTGRAIAWGASFTGNLLTTTVATKTHVQELVYDSAGAKWVGTYADAVGY